MSKKRIDLIFTALDRVLKIQRSRNFINKIMREKLTI